MIIKRKSNSLGFSKKIFLLFFLFLLSKNIYSQTRIIDSLRTVIKNSKQDTALASAHIVLGEWICLEKSDSAILLWEKAKKIIDSKLNQLKPTDKEYNVYLRLNAGYFHDMGFINMELGKISDALKNHQQSLSIQEKIKNNNGIAEELTFIGNIYRNQDDIPNTLKCYERALRIHEKNGNKQKIATVLNNIALVYSKQKDDQTAIEYLRKSLTIQEEIKDKAGIGLALNNIGQMYYSMGEKVKAEEYLLKSLKIRQELKDKKGEAYTLLAIANIYGKYGDPSVTSSKEASQKAGELKALRYFENALEIAESIKNKNLISIILIRIGNIYYYQRNFSKAIYYCNKGLLASNELGFPDNIKLASSSLYKIYKKSGNHKLALENYELYIKMNDSVNSEINRKAGIKSKLKYEYEKQAAADSVAHAKESEIKNAEIAKQTAEIKAKKNQQYALFGGLGLVMIFAGFMYNRFKVTQKQKTIIEHQKAEVEEQKILVEEKQKEILDSIHYAERIQKAHLPSEKYVIKSLERLNKF